MSPGILPAPASASGVVDASPALRSLIVLDATPLGSGHGIRGIGRYVGGITEALLTEEADFAVEHVRLLIAGNQAYPDHGAQVLRTHRSNWRPQDTGWLIAMAADRRAARGARGATWHQTDPMLPESAVGHGLTIVTAYDLIPLHEPEVWTSIRPHRRAVYRRYLAALSRSKGVIAISETTARDVSRTLGVPPHRIRVVPPSVRPETRVALRTERGDEPNLLYVGVMEAHKRPELAVATLAALRSRGADAKLAFVGPSPAARVQSMQRLAGELGVLNDVRFMGRVPDDELASLYRRSILLATSRIEGFGLPPVEALLAGGRVVAVPTEIYREVLGGAAEYSHGADRESLADAVERAMRDECPATERRALADRVSPALAATRLRAAYEELTG